MVSRRVLRGGVEDAVRQFEDGLNIVVGRLFGKDVDADLLRGGERLGWVAGGDAATAETAGGGHGW